MADTRLAEKAKALYARREEANAKCLIPKRLPIFTERLKPLQFWDYFYDSEQELLRTNCDERIRFRNKRTQTFFKDDADLQEYLQNLRAPNQSSHDEDRPPPSEELFLSDDNLYDHIMNSTRYCPALTTLQRNLLHSLSRNVYEAGDSIDMIGRKRVRRIELIRGYCKDLKRKRYARTYNRYTKIRAKKLLLNEETMALMHQELQDKALTRPFYYDRNEPSEMRTLLQRERCRAIQRKYKQYTTDPDFRRAYRDQVYYNVNKEVPPNDDQHMHGHTVVVYDDEVHRVDHNRTFYGPVAQMQRIRVKRIDSSNRTLNASGLETTLMNETRTGRNISRAVASARSRTLSPAARALLKKYDLDEPTHDTFEAVPSEYPRKKSSSQIDDSYDQFASAVEFPAMNSTALTDEEYAQNVAQSRRPGRNGPKQVYKTNRAGQVSYSYDAAAAETSHEDFIDIDELVDGEQTEYEEEVEYEDDEDEQTTDYDEEPTDLDEANDDDDEELSEEQTAEATEDDEETATYNDEPTDYDEEQSEEQDDEQTSAEGEQDYAEEPTTGDYAAGTEQQESDEDDTDQFEEAVDCADKYFQPNLDQSLNATASFGSMDDEFVPSSELEFISDDFNDAPETPGWKKPMSRHKTELFRQLFRMEQANRANDPKEVQRLREMIIRKYHISIIKRRRQQAIRRIQEVLRQGLSIRNEAARLEKMELHDKMLDRGFYYDPNEPLVYTRLLNKRRRAIALKYEYYANYDQFRRQFKERVMSGTQRPIEVPDYVFN